ncbi:MAG: sulfite exporter TauE/SafE family protein [Deltaproteobacteria bacterium]|nr:sulfite exporter TauE/SafE family protein [Deltaproteobacteria bacterium]
MEISLFILTGLMAGFIGGLLGLGGGILLMPVLRFAFDMPVMEAVGITILSVFFVTISGSYYHYKLGHINFPSLTPVIIAGAFSSFLFSFIFNKMMGHTEWIDCAIGLVFLIVSARMIRAGLRKRMGRDAFSRFNNRLPGTIFQKGLIGVFAGAMPGLLGIGTGAILVPIFTFTLKASIKVAIGSSLACFTINALVSAVMKWHQGLIDLSTALPIGLGAVLGAIIGSTVNNRIPSSALKFIFGIIFLYVSSKFILSPWGIKI